MMTLKYTDKSIYRLVEEIDGVVHNLGTCFHIGSGTFLTCWHVLLSHESLKGKEKDIRDQPIHFGENTYLIGGTPERLYNLSWKRHWDPHHNQYFDVAAGRLPPGEPIPDSLSYNLNFTPQDSIELKCRGYGESNSNLKGTRTFHCAGQDSRTCYFVMDNSLAPGYSGSPVFKDDRVIGIICADNSNKACSYGIGINRIWQWLESTFGSLEHSTPIFSDPVECEISKYPLTINFKLYNLHTAELSEIVLLKLLSIENTVEFIHEVNTNLLAVTDLPDAHRSLVIDEFSLSKHNVRSFIHDMFYNAASKSSRTVGAILETNSVFAESRLTENEQILIQQTKQLLGKT